MLSVLKWKLCVSKLAKAAACQGEKRRQGRGLLRNTISYTLMAHSGALKRLIAS